MIIKFLILFSLLKIVFSSKDVKDVIEITSSNVDKIMEEHVIGTAFILFENKYDFKTIAQKMVNDMNTRFGKSWICQIGSNNTFEIYFDEKIDSYITFTFKEIGVTLFKANLNNNIENKNCSQVINKINFILFLYLMSS